MNPIILGIIRHALTAGGGALVAKGLTDQTGADQIIGGIITLIGVIWSAYHKTQVTSQVKQAALTGTAPLIALAFITLSLAGCARIQPDANRLIVRAEQTEEVADSTFSLFLHVEHENHAIVKEKMPQVTDFAEWLRTPTLHAGTNTARANALVYSVQEIKAAYRSDLSNSNLLDSVTVTLTEAIKKAANLTATINAK